MAGAAFAEIAGAAFFRDQRDGRFCLFLRGSGCCLQRVLKAHTAGGRLFEHFRHRQPDVHHGFVARGRLSARNQAGTAVGDGLRERCQIGFVFTVERRRGLDEEGAVKRAAGAADGGEQHHADAFAETAEVFACLCRQFFLRLAEAAVHVQAVVAVADGGIERGQFVLRDGKRGGAAVYPVDVLAVGKTHARPPLLQPGVHTGASKSSSTASSALSRVMEMPCMSSEVQYEPTRLRAMVRPKSAQQRASA